MRHIIASLWLLAACEGGSITLTDDTGGGGPGGGGPGGGGPGGETDVVDTDESDTDEGGADAAAFCANGCTWTAVEAGTVGGGGLLFTGVPSHDAVVDATDIVRVVSADPFAREVVQFTETPLGFSLARVRDLPRRLIGAYVASPTLGIAAAPGGGVAVATADARYRLMVPDGAGWTGNQDAEVGAANLNPSSRVAYDAAGVMHWFVEGSYRSGAPGAWTAGPVAAAAPAQVVFEGAGTPVIRWWEGSVPRIAALDGGRWRNRAISGATPAAARLAVTPNGALHALVSRAGSSQLQLLSWNGSGRDAERVTTTLASGTTRIGLSADPAGRLHAAWVDDTGALVYGWRDGAVWREEVVASVDVDRLWALVRSDGEPVIVTLAVEDTGRREDLMAYRAARC